MGQTDAGHHPELLSVGLLPHAASGRTLVACVRRQETAGHGHRHQWTLLSADSLVCTCRKSLSDIYNMRDNVLLKDYHHIIGGHSNLSTMNSARS